jgi:4-diphosphocytidyl-2-C-methyl-D-erythritol kinase
MVAFPPCKINLGLYVTGKRADGFHDLATCFYPLPWNDMLEVIPSDSFSFTASGLLIAGSPADNLCVRAYQLLKKDFNIPPVAIYLHKIVPLGAGLGGGSADGAWTLRLLNQVFDLNLSSSQLLRYASTLGSDCSFFMFDKPMLGWGRGEVLTETTVDLSQYYFAVAKPPVHVTTAEAFKGISPRKSDHDLKNLLESVPVSDWKTFLRNDFEESIFKKYPAIAALKESMYASGAVYAAMSGSGSAVFGIFSKPVHLNDKFSGMHYHHGKFEH